MSSNQFIPLASPNITEEDIQAVNAVLRSGMLVQGEQVLGLEKLICEYTGSKYAIALSNGTSTLHLALLALGIGVGDEVIIPAYSYVATANVVELVGARCVFVDIDLNTFNIDITQIEDKITPRTKAIMPVHEFGLAANMSVIMDLANKYDLHIIEDAACALGAKYKDQHVGTFGVFGSISLHPRKSITSGEGGILLTQSAVLAEKIRIKRNHGIQYVDTKMEFVDAGYNYRMTDFQAALAASQLRRLDEILKVKNELAQIYLSDITNTDLVLPQGHEDRQPTWQTFHILLGKKYNQKEILDYLKSKNIGSNYGAQCIPAMQYYREKYKLNFEQLYPNSYLAFTSGIGLPLYEKLNEKDILYISEILNGI